MKVFASYVFSLILAFVIGWYMGYRILHAMAGYPNWGGGGSWDLAPLFIPLFSLPGIFICHGITFAGFSKTQLSKRFAIALMSGALGYAGTIAGVAVVLGYKG